jgi:hypothetical protein
MARASTATNVIDELFSLRCALTDAVRDDFAAQ